MEELHNCICICTWIYDISHRLIPYTSHNHMRLISYRMLSLYAALTVLVAPHDGREVPETCRAVIIIIKIPESCMSLVTFKEFICNDAWSYECKLQSNHYRNVSTDPLGTGCESLGTRKHTLGTNALSQSSFSASSTVQNVQAAPLTCGRRQNRFADI